MTKTEILAWLRANRNARGVAHWKAMEADNGGLASDGIGLTQLRKFAKTIQRDHRLAQSLWKTNHHEAKVLGLLLDEPKRITQEQAEAQVGAVEPGYLAHVFSSCDATLAKTDFAFQLAKKWVDQSDSLKKRCGYGLVYELSKSKRDAANRDPFYHVRIDRIRKEIENADPCLKVAMGGALIGIGKRSPSLNAAAIVAAKEIGPIDFNDGDSKCEPMDVVKHLTSDGLKKRLGIS